ncbi:MAG: hypothetical protein ACR2RV_21265 [Verrucomicrobiales bacterium]
MTTRLRFLPLALALMLGGCEKSNEPKQELPLEKVIALVGELSEEIDTGYKMNAEVWNGQTAVVSIGVDDPLSDYASEVIKFTKAEALSRFDGKVLVVFRQDQPITARERAAGLTASTLILAAFDARTGERR